MDRYHLIKVIKRDERERLEQQAAGSTHSESPAREKARGLAATVKEWISESRQNRLARYQESKQQLGWSENEGDGPRHHVVRGSRQGEN